VYKPCDRGINVWPNNTWHTCAANSFHPFCLIRSSSAKLSSMLSAWILIISQNPCRSAHFNTLPSSVGFCHRKQSVILRKTSTLYVISTYIICSIYLKNIHLYIVIHYINNACNRRVHWKLSSREFHCWPRRKPRSTVEFQGWLFPMYPSIAGFIYYIILNVVK
jgi:hypothetical protein